MQWKDYSHLKGSHAFCGASNCSWRNYDVEKLLLAKERSYATTIGTKLHEYAAANIAEKFKILKTDKRSILRFLTVENHIPQSAVDIDRLFPNLMNYVNDMISFRMDPEVVLYYSPDFYGTTDAISYENDVLRIADLKTGVTPASFVQLENYAAFFCLNYKVKPSQLKKLEFRIYQNNEIMCAEPNPEIISPIINQIITFNNVLMDVEGVTRNEHTT